MSKFVDEIIQSMDGAHSAWSQMESGSVYVGGDGLRCGSVKVCQIGNTRPWSVVCVFVNDVEVPLHGWFDRWRLESAAMRWFRRAKLQDLMVRA